MSAKRAAASTSQPRQECFVIMPISDPEGYQEGHFQRVYDDIFRPACEDAGFDPVRANDVRQTNLIHLDILQRIIDSRMAPCDLSSRNPNVLFELGVRQAFDKPVALVREAGTPDIFDIAPLRVTDYRKDRIYHEVLEDQKNVAELLKATWQASAHGEGINSIVKLLSLSGPANLADVAEADKDPALQLVRAEISELRSEIRRARRIREFESPSTREIRAIPSLPLAEAEELVRKWLKGGLSRSHIDRRLRGLGVHGDFVQDIIKEIGSEEEAENDSGD